MASDYKKHTQDLYTEKTLDLLDSLPAFCTDYYVGRKLRLAAKTQFDYASKMRVFLQYLCDNHESFCDKKIMDITLEDLNKLRRDDMEYFAAWLTQQPTRKNSSANYGKNTARTADNYLACLSSYWEHFISKDLLEKNPIKGMDREKKPKKKIIYLEKDDRNHLLDTVWEGGNLTEKQKQFRDKSNSTIRDACMIQILCDTGIRVAELVGLDIDDIDMKKHCFTVVRKGNNEDTVSFSDITGQIIENYLEERKSYLPVDSERALFLVSLGRYKGERISIRSVQNIVKKYAKAAGVPNAGKMSPHKFRSTYAMHMLEATGGNISLVQKQLGHARIETTTLYAEENDKTKETYRNSLFNTDE